MIGSTFIGNSSWSGSAIYSLRSLSVSDSTFTANSASFSGAITFTNGTLTVANSTFVGNAAAFGPNDGTAIYNDGNPPTIPLRRWSSPTAFWTHPRQARRA